MASKYRVERIAEAMFVVVRGDEYLAAGIHDTYEAALAAAAAKNGAGR